MNAELQRLTYTAVAAVLLSSLLSCSDAPGEGAGGNTAATDTVATGVGGQGAAGGAGQGGQAAAPELSLLSWNLQNFPKSAATIDAVKSVLDSRRPDLVGLEELDADADFEALDTALPDYQGLLAMSGDGFVRVGLLYRADRIAISDAQMVFADDGYAFPRAMLAVHVTRLDDPAQDFLLGIVHLKAQLDAESAERRRVACLKLDQWMAAQIQGGVESEIVIAGDFNDELTDAPNWNVFGPLLDAQEGAFLTAPLELAGGYTYVPFKSFIDHIYVRGPALSATSSAEVIALDETVMSYVDTVSDHRPVFATLRFSSN